MDNFTDYEPEISVPTTKNDALLMRSEFYYTECPVHGFAQFHTVRESCDACFRASFNDDPAIAALNSGQAFYDDTCATHGPTKHFARGRRCSLCFTATGAPRASKSVRAQARDAAATSFEDFCTECAAMTPHHVGHGRCLACFDLAGRRRSQGRVQSPRAAARAAGNPAFIESCAKHGDAAHSVAHGKCLTCFTTTGMKRTRQPG